MASIFGALGSLAEGYGLARQGLIEEQKQKAQTKLEQMRASLEERRAGLEEQNLRLAQQEFEARQKRRDLIPVGIKPYLDSQTGERVYTFWDPQDARMVEQRTPGGGASADALKAFISKQPQEFQQKLTNMAQMLSVASGGDFEAVIPAVTNYADKLSDQKAAVDQRMTEMELRQQFSQQMTNARQAFALDLFLKRQAEQEKLSPLRYKAAQQFTQLEKAMQVGRQILAHKDLLDNMLTAGKIKFVLGADGQISQALAGQVDFTPEEAQMAADLKYFQEAINLERGPMGATGFRGTQAYANLQGQIGNIYLPKYTEDVLNNTMQAFQGLQYVNIRTLGPEAVQDLTMAGQEFDQSMQQSGSNSMPTVTIDPKTGAVTLGGTPPK